MDLDYVLTDPAHLVKTRMKEAGYDLDKMKMPKRVFILADCIYGEMLDRDLGEYIAPLAGMLYAFKNNPDIGFTKGKMCSPGIATQAEVLLVGGVEELIHIGYAGGLQTDMNIGDIVVTDGAFNDTAIARLYGYDYDFLETSKELTDEVDKLLRDNSVNTLRGKHWTTDAGFRETWGQILDYRSKGALCVEMEGVGLFTIAKYRNCKAAAVYIISDTLDKEGWSLGWEGNKIEEAKKKVIDIIVGSISR